MNDNEITISILETEDFILYIAIVTKIFLKYLNTLEMSHKLQDMVTSYEIPVSHSSKASSASGGSGKCFGSLLSCFKFTRKEESEENFTDYEHQDCDYIVEKLIVKRMPFVFVAVPTDNLESKNDIHHRYIRKLFSVTEANTMYSSASESGSLYHSDGLNQNTMPMEISNNHLHFDVNINPLNKRNKTNIISTDYNTGMTEVMSTTSNLSSDLKEYERPPKNPYPFNTSKNKNALSKNVAEIASIKRIANKSNESPMQETFASFPVTFVPDFPLMKKELKCLGSSEMKSKNEQKVYNLRQVQNIYLDESPDDNISNQLNVEDCNREHANIKPQVNGRLQYNQEISANEAKVLAENIANIDLSSITLKWKIIVKHHKSKL